MAQEANVVPAIGVGLLGLGVVGQGVYEALYSRAATYMRRGGRALEVRRIAVRDVSRQRDVKVESALLCDDPLAVAVAPEIEIVVELMGGEQPAPPRHPVSPPPETGCRAAEAGAPPAQLH